METFNEKTLCRWEKNCVRLLEFHSCSDGTSNPAAITVSCQDLMMLIAHMRTTPPAPEGWEILYQRAEDLSEVIYSEDEGWMAFLERAEDYPLLVGKRETALEAISAVECYGK